MVQFPVNKLFLKRGNDDFVFISTHFDLWFCFYFQLILICKRGGLCLVVRHFPSQFFISYQSTKSDLGNYQPAASILVCHDKTVIKIPPSALKANFSTPQIWQQKPPVVFFFKYLQLFSQHLQQIPSMYPEHERSHMFMLFILIYL